MVVVHTVPYIVFRLALFVLTQARAEADEGVGGGEGGRGRERFWCP